MVDEHEAAAAAAMATLWQRDPETAAGPASRRDAPPQGGCYSSSMPPIRRFPPRRRVHSSLGRRRDLPPRRPGRPHRELVAGWRHRR